MGTGHSLTVIDADTFLELTVPELLSMNIPVGDAKKIWKAKEAVKYGSPAPPPGQRRDGNPLIIKDWENISDLSSLPTLPRPRDVIEIPPPPIGDSLTGLVYVFLDLQSSRYVTEIKAMSTKSLENQPGRSAHLKLISLEQERLVKVKRMGAHQKFTAVVGFSIDSAGVIGRNSCANEWTFNRRSLSDHVYDELCEALEEESKRRGFKVARDSSRA